VISEQSKLRINKAGSAHAAKDKPKPGTNYSRHGAAAWRQSGYRFCVFFTATSAVTIDAKADPLI